MQHDGMDKVKKLHGKLCWLQLKTKLTEENAESKNLRENCDAKIDMAVHLVDVLWNLILDDVHEAHTWQEDDWEAEDKEVEILLFVSISTFKKRHLLILQ
jgi:hypothetical protein